MEKDTAPIFKNPSGMTKCPECGKSYDTEWALRLHWGHSHDKPAPWWRERENAERDGKWWEYQRNKRLEIDNHTCQKCSHDGSDYMLVVHHITPFNEFDNDSFPHHLSNLVTLCNRCHNSVESLPESKQRSMFNIEVKTDEGDMRLSTFTCSDD